MSLSEFQESIVKGCASAVETAMKTGSGHHIFPFGDHVVKFNHTNIFHEGDTQAFVYQEAEKSPDAPRVPKVHECFSWGGLQYLVMERIAFPTVDKWLNDASESEVRSRRDEACRAVANALRWLFGLSAPAGAPIGLIEGPYARTLNEGHRTETGRARHSFFGPDGASYRYSSASVLQDQINTALRTRRPLKAPPLAVDISDEKLVMVQGDINPGNFLIDPDTRRVTIIDFGAVSVLPESFVDFTLRSRRDGFVTGIAWFLCWKPSDNFSALAAAVWPLMY